MIVGHILLDIHMRDHDQHPAFLGCIIDVGVVESAVLFEWRVSCGAPWQNAAPYTARSAVSCRRCKGPFALLRLIATCNLPDIFRTRPFIRDDICTKDVAGIPFGMQAEFR